MDVTHGLENLAPDIQLALDEALAAGEYASPGEIVVAALQDWAVRRRGDADALAALRADIDQGLAEFEAGSTVPFDLADLQRRGRLRSSARSDSA